MAGNIVDRFLRPQNLSGETEIDMGSIECNAGETGEDNYMVMSKSN